MKLLKSHSFAEDRANQASFLESRAAGEWSPAFCLPSETWHWQTRLCRISAADSFSTLWVLYLYIYINMSQIYIYIYIYYIYITAHCTYIYIWLYMYIIDIVTWIVIDGVEMQENQPKILQTKPYKAHVQVKRIPNGTTNPRIPTSVLAEKLECHGVWSSHLDTYPL